MTAQPQHNLNTVVGLNMDMKMTLHTTPPQKLNGSLLDQHLLTTTKYNVTSNNKKGHNNNIYNNDNNKTTATGGGVSFSCQTRQLRLCLVEVETILSYRSEW